MFTVILFSGWWSSTCRTQSCSNITHSISKLWPGKHCSAASTNISQASTRSAAAPSLSLGHWDPLGRDWESLGRGRDPLGKEREYPGRDWELWEKSWGHWDTLGKDWNPIEKG